LSQHLTVGSLDFSCGAEASEKRTCKAVERAPTFWGNCSKPTAHGTAGFFYVFLSAIIKRVSKFNKYRREVEA